jgi:hypothetical protein
MKPCSVSSASDSEATRRNSMRSTTLVISTEPRVTGFEKWLCTRFLTDFALPT